MVETWCCRLYIEAQVEQLRSQLTCVSSEFRNNIQTDHYVIMPVFLPWKLISFPAPSTVVQFFQFINHYRVRARAVNHVAFPRIRKYPHVLQLYCFTFGRLAAKTVILIILYAYIASMPARSLVCCPSSVFLPYARSPSSRYDFLDLLIHKISMKMRRAKTRIQITFICPFDWNTRARIFTT